jgi:4-diphosphocytidyl-2-C-methyl-D-erythritol kinase
MKFVTQSPCKVNLLLNILGRRADGFHELETVMHPVRLDDELAFSQLGDQIELTCNDARLPTDSRNLVYRAAELFLRTAKLKQGIRMHLEKRIPLAAGLGGGSANAATTLLGLNEMFGNPLALGTLSSLAASLGSDVPFFLQDKPALATGRGEIIESLDFPSPLKGTALLLVHPGFGIASAWAYQQLRRFPSVVNGRAGRARELIALLREGDLKGAGKQFYNSLEAPALEKYPLLAIFQDFFHENAALGTLMSGSGSTTFAIFDGPQAATEVSEKFKAKFGTTHWIAIVPC